MDNIREESYSDGSDLTLDDLSCGSSPFEVSGESDSVQASSEGEGGAVNDVNILPYQFESYLPEPEATSSNDNDASGERIDRRNDNSW